MSPGGGGKRKDKYMRPSLDPVFRALRQLFIPTPQVGPVFAKYQEASETGQPSGYEDPDIVDAVVAKTLHTRDEVRASHQLSNDAMGIMHGIAALLPSPSLSVLDFGGAAGHHYFSVRAIVGDAIPIRWNVVETPKMVAAASPKLADSSLRFFTSIEEAASDLGHVQLVLSSSSLPYTPDPLGYLSKLLGVRADHLFITRTPLTDADETFSIVQKSRLAHNGPGPLPPGFVDREVQYPLTFVNLARFRSSVEHRYSLRFAVDEASGVHYGGGFRGKLYGFFYDKI